MSGKRIIRFFIGLVVALVIVPLVLPLVGVPRSHFLPPGWVYAQAKGQASGMVLSERYSMSNDPFQVGLKLFFIKYVFLAKPPTPAPDGKKYEHYYGEVQVDKDMYDKANPGQAAPIKYELTYPDINGIDYEGAGLGCNGPNNILGPWLIWIGLILVVAVVFLLIFERMGSKEDI